jgi:proteasome-associated ATPase
MIETMDKMEEKIRQHNEMLEMLTEPPLSVSMVSGITKENIRVVNSDGQTEVVNKPYDGTTCKIGDLVHRSSQTGQIVEVMEPDIDYGNICMVIDAEDGEAYCTAEIGGQQRSVLKGAAGKDVMDGCYVVTDNSGSIILKDLGRPKSKFKPERTANIQWSDIGGLEDAKEKLRESIEYPFEFAETYERFGRTPANGVLLYGPPGCGKTMLAKAVANSLRQRMGGEEGSNFIYVKGPEILERWVGAAEANIRHLFTMAREHFEAHGYPAVVFIDEADAILGRRGSGISSDMERTIVPQFLSEMSGFQNSGAVTLLATNRSDVLDPAVVRDGRVDHKVYIGRPDEEASKEIVQIHLQGVPCDSRRDYIARVAVEALFQGHIIYQVTFRDGEEAEFSLKHLVSGAMLAGVADKAASRAMAREIKCKGRKQHSVGCGDMEAAVEETFKQNWHLSHDDALQEFAENYGKDIRAVTKVR